MAQKYTYGLGGYCENCDPLHDHPLHNLISVVEIEDAEPPTDAQAIAEALAQLPADTLNTLKQALGI